MEILGLKKKHDKKENCLKPRIEQDTKEVEEDQSTKAIRKKENNI
mgnify:CR=1 FL=1